MDLLIPDFGLLIWSLLSFSIVLVILKKFAWKPILNALKKREKSIEEALSAADRAKEEMERLGQVNEKIMAKAMKERNKIIDEASEYKEKIIAETKHKMEEETRLMIKKAKKNIEAEKKQAVDEIRKQIVHLSIDIAERILKEKLETKDEQMKLMSSLVKEIKLN